MRVLGAQHEVEGGGALPRLLNVPPQEAEVAPSPASRPRQSHHHQVADDAVEVQVLQLLTDSDHVHEGQLAVLGFRQAAERPGHTVETLSPFLIGRTFASPIIGRRIRQTLLCFLT